VDIDAVTDDGWTPVLLAAAAGSAGIIRMLQEHARDKRLENTFMMQRLPKGQGVDAGLDVLLLGARYGHQEVVREALDSGANLATQDPRGNYPLHVAVVGGTPAHLDTMLLLLERGALWNEQNEKSYTPPLLARNHQEYCRCVRGGMGSADACSNCCVTEARPFLADVELRMQVSRLPPRHVYHIVLHRISKQGGP
jgi:ankyrin repeat protein